MADSCSIKSLAEHRMHADYSLHTTISDQRPWMTPTAPYIGSEEQEYAAELDHCRNSLQRGGLSTASYATDARQLTKSAIWAHSSARPIMDNGVRKPRHQNRPYQQGDNASSTSRRKSRTAVITLPPHHTGWESTSSNGCPENTSL